MERDLRVFKYELNWEVEQELKLPLEKVLDIQIQNGKPCLWALIDNSISYRKTLHLQCVGTGTKDYNLTYGTHIATIQNGGFVWHWFCWISG